MREAISNLSSKKINQNNIQKQKSTLRCLIQNAGESVYGFWKPRRNPLPPKKHFLRPRHIFLVLNTQEYISQKQKTNDFFMFL